jgi:hypothetical protein
MNAKPKNENLPPEAMNACLCQQDEGVMLEGMIVSPVQERRDCDMTARDKIQITKIHQSFV